MRSLEYLAQLYPNKTAKELLAIQAKDKEDDEKAYQKANAKKLAFIKDINDNGGYFKGVFGLDQHYYYNVTNMSIEGKTLRADVEKIIIFLGAERAVVPKGEMNIEVRKKTYVDIGTYDLTNCVRTTKEDFEECKKYLDGLAKFFVGVAEKMYK